MAVCAGQPRMASGGPAAAAARLVLVTGPPNVGKTTLVRGVIDGLGERVPFAGFYTEEVRSAGGQRCGFEVVSVGGWRSKRATLATSDASTAPSACPRVGKYAVLVDEFDSVALPVFQSASTCQLSVQPSSCSSTAAKSGLLILDEIGKMEAFSERFCQAVSDWLRSDVRGVLLATIPSKSAGLPIVERVRAAHDSVIVTLTRENRKDRLNEVRQLIDRSVNKYLNVANS